jgi:hypothetical protein
MADISLETKSVVVALFLAIFVAAVIVYRVLVRHEPFDSEGIRFIGVLLGLAIFAFIYTVFKAPVVGDEWWIDLLLFGFAAFFVWLVRPRK